MNTQELLHSAVPHWQAGRLEDARSCFQKALAGSPENFDALHLLGVLEHKLGQVSRAQELITKALSINPGFPDAHYNLAKVLEDQGRLQEAAISYEKAVSLEPGLDIGHFNLALIHLRLGHLDKAVSSLQKAIAINPNDPDYHFNLGGALKSLDNAASAIACYQAAIRLNPENPAAHNNLGIVFRESEKYDRAIASYRQAIKIDPDYADAHFNLANAYDETGQLNEAVSSYLKAIAIQPGLVKAYNNLANGYYKMGEDDKAMAAYQKAVDLDPASVSARHMLNSLKGTTTETAPIQYVENLFDKAAEDFENRLVNDLKYNSPQELRTLLNELLGKEPHFQNAIDLGCGTGLSGQQFRAVSECLTGVDISSKMIDAAKRKNSYDALEVGEILNFLTQSPETYDLFVAADVLAYFGNLVPLFAEVRRKAMRGAYFLFTIEDLEKGDYLLRKTGRYCHSRDYIEKLAAENQFAIASCQPTVIRMENDRPIAGKNYILKLR